MSYFSTLLELRQISPLNVKFHKNLFVKRLNFFSFMVGDVVNLLFEKSGYYFLFEGVCLSISKGSLTQPETTFVLCNVLAGIVVELRVSYYYNLAFIFRTINSKYNLLFSRRAKLHYLRNKLTKGSRTF